MLFQVLSYLSYIPRLMIQRFSQKTVEQFIVTGTSSFAMIVGNPFIADQLGGSGQWLNLSRSLLCLGVTGLLSGIPVRVLKPMGHALQNRGSPTKNIAGLLIMLVPEVLYSIVGFQVLAPIFGWDREKAFLASVSQGGTRSFSSALISGKWGEGSPAWTLIRQASMVLMVTNSSAMTTIASTASTDKESWLAKHYVWEIAGFNFLIAGAVLLTPKRLFA